MEQFNSICLHLCRGDWQISCWSMEWKLIKVSLDWEEQSSYVATQGESNVLESGSASLENGDGIMTW